MNNYLGFYNGPLQASAGFSWASTGFYGPNTGHFEPLRTSTYLYWPQLATFAINGRHTGICMPLRAFSDTPASNGTIVGQFWSLMDLYRPLMGHCEPHGPSSGLMGICGPVRATWASHGHLQASIGLIWPLMGYYWPQPASHGPLRATHGPLRAIWACHGPLLASSDVYVHPPAFRGPLLYVHCGPQLASHGPLQPST